MSSEWDYEDIAALARKRAIINLNPSHHHGADDDAGEDPENNSIGYLYRSVSALASINDEIWSRVAPQLSGFEDNVLAVRARYRKETKEEEDNCWCQEMDATTNNGCKNGDPDVDDDSSSSWRSEPQMAAMTTTITPQIEVNSFGSAVPLPFAIRQVVPVPHSDPFPKALLDHSTIAEASLLLHPQIARHFLRRFHSYLQELQLFLGSIDEWICEPQHQDTVLNNSIAHADIWEMEPCKNLPYQIYLGELDTLAKATSVVGKINKQLQEKHKKCSLPAQEERDPSLDWTQDKEHCCEMEFWTTEAMMDQGLCNSSSSSGVRRPSSTPSLVSTVDSENSDGVSSMEEA